MNLQKSSKGANLEEGLVMASTSASFGNLQPLTSTPKRSRSELEASFSRILEYGSDGVKTNQVTQSIGEMICRDSLPYSLVEGFKRFMKVVAPLYRVPCRKTITTLIDSKYEEKKPL